MDLIIGAGVTGISYANFTTNNFLIIEKEKEVGGYCRTIKRNGFVWDYSGHFFHFQNPDVPPVDLIVRSAGEFRISNFLLFDSAYAEFVFCDKLWPDWGEKDVSDVIDTYNTRVRRFGGVVQ